MHRAMAKKSSMNTMNGHSSSAVPKFWLYDSRNCRIASMPAIMSSRLSNAVDCTAIVARGLQSKDAGQRFVR